MAKIVFTPVIIALVAAILSLSAIATAFADDGGTGGNSSPSDDESGAHQPQQVGKIPDYSRCSSGSSCAVRAPNDNNNGAGGGGGGGNGDNSVHHKIDNINKLFRSMGGGNNDDGSSALANIPVIPKIDFPQTNGTNSTTATVTIPICDGIVPGPCLDKTTRQIIP